MRRFVRVQNKSFVPHTSHGKRLYVEDLLLWVANHSFLPFHSTKLRTKEWLAWIICFKKNDHMAPYPMIRLIFHCFQGQYLIRIELIHSHSFSQLFCFFMRSKKSSLIQNDIAENIWMNAVQCFWNHWLYQDLENEGEGNRGRSTTREGSD